MAKRRVWDAAYGLSEKYLYRFRIMAHQHPVYTKSWIVPFFKDDRCLNWILYDQIVKTPGAERMTVLEACAYDGFLTALLRRRGIEAYGCDDNPWPEMWNLLDVGKYMNIPPAALPRINLFLFQGWVHMIKPEQLYGTVLDLTGGRRPDVCVFDRNRANPHPGMRPYFDDQVLQHLELEVVTYPNCRDENNPVLQKDFLVHTETDG